jgi:hypothetical protein
MSLTEMTQQLRSDAASLALASLKRTNPHLAETLSVKLNDALRRLLHTLQEAEAPSDLKYSDDQEAYSAALAKLMAKLKKDIGATAVRQNYKGTGSKKHHRQIWVSLPGHPRGGPDVWFENGFVRVGGIIAIPKSIPSTRKFENDSPAVIYGWIRDTLKATMAAETAKYADQGKGADSSKTTLNAPSNAPTTLGALPANQTEVSPEVERLAKTIDAATDQNDHTGSIILLAKFLKSEKWVERLTILQDLHDAWGSLPPGAHEVRTQAMDELFAQVAKQLNSAEHKRLHDAF